MKIDSKIIKEMAFWVRVRLREEEAEQMAASFSETLSWIDREMITDELEGVQPMPSVIEDPIRMRTDEVTDGGKQKEILSCSEHAVDGFFTVPKMVE